MAQWTAEATAAQAVLPANWIKKKPENLLLRPLGGITLRLPTNSARVGYASTHPMHAHQGAAVEEKPGHALRPTSAG
ncbi:MAG TPA: hypothetical protein VFA18_15640 [Gemmataceae bacterium]|nr:hypothetical protein [Gemmataceae bacterium]